MDSMRLMPKRKITLAGLAMAVGPMLLIWWASDSRADDAFSSEPVQVEIGERGYAVPRNYISHVTRNTEDGHDETAVLRAVWPDFEPRTRDNNQFWRRRHPTRQIRIHIEERGLEGYQQLENVLSAASRSTVPFGVQGQAVTHGLLEFSRSLGDGRIHRYLVVAYAGYLTPAGFPVVFQCNDPTTDSDKEIFDVELLCIAEYQLEDGAWLKVHFFMVNLEHWREIDTAVRTLVDSFRR